MKKLIFFIFIFYNVLYAQEYYVIAHKDNITLTPSEIRAIFLKKMAGKDGVHFVPLNLSSKNSVRQKFERHILKMNFQRLKSYWAKEHYKGHRAPLSMKSEAAVISFVNRVSGSIAYIKAKKLDSKNITIIYKWSE